MTITDFSYSQKSRLFLQPLIELKKDSHIKPIGTYVIDPSRGVTERDYKLVVPFEKDDSSEFHVYENTYILSSRYIDAENYYEIDGLAVYFFDLSSYKDDFDRFLEGSYTKFTQRVKTLINLYWGKVIHGRFDPHPKIQAYINPDLSTYEKVAEELGLKVEDLIEIEQLIDPPNLVKETFDIKSVKYSRKKVKLEN